MILTNIQFLWELLGAVLALDLLPATFEMLALTIAGMFRTRKQATRRCEELYRLVVLIPAHDEALSIQRCIESIRRADTTGVALRVVVVADNCADATAKMARGAGAEVLVRFDRERRGKGYALNFAFNALARHGADDSSAVDGFAVVDADTEIQANFLVETANALRCGADATQCRYLVRNPNSSIRTRLMQLATAAYNVLRARGRANLGFSAGLYGNGFALSASTLQQVPYAAYSVVEDVEYHLMLLAAGRHVTFLDRTSVYADMPAAGAGVDNQRARWEGGRLRIAYTKLPSVLRRLTRGEFRFFEAGLDLFLLPLAFHVLLLLVLVLSPVPAIRWLGAIGIGTTLLHLVLASFVAGNGFKDLPILFAAPFYILWKILLIPKLHKSSKAHAQWIRTERIAEITPNIPKVGKP